ncbi:MAG: hypothetical protein ACRBN8_42020 [Nannocystales bacterium]
MIDRAFLAGVSVAWTLSAVACTNGEGNEPNVLPDPTGGSSSTGTSTVDPPTTTQNPTLPVTGSGSGSSGSAGGDPTPVTYRFDCIDIQTIGDADSTVIQAQLLENTWGSDIDQLKLNIMLEAASRDAEAGEALLGIRSGVGAEASGLCSQAETISDLIPVAFAADDTRWGPASAVGECSVPATGTDGSSYTMELPPERVVYIYSEDDDVTPFNCTPDAAVPDAVPIRAVQAEVSTDASEGTVWGTLNGCLLESEAQSLCSCLGSCTGEGPDDLQTEGECAGCPTGGTPLAVLLGGVNTSENCTSIMGAPAFDLRLGFSGVALPHVPTACG